MLTIYVYNGKGYRVSYRIQSIINFKLIDSSFDFNSMDFFALKFAHSWICISVQMAEQPITKQCTPPPYSPCCFAIRQLPKGRIAGTWSLETALSNFRAVTDSAISINNFLMVFLLLRTKIHQERYASTRGSWMEIGLTFCCIDK